MLNLNINIFLTANFALTKQSFDHSTLPLPTSLPLREKNVSEFCLGCVWFSRQFRGFEVRAKTLCTEQIKNNKIRNKIITGIRKEKRRQQQKLMNTCVRVGAVHSAYIFTSIRTLKLNTLA